MAYVGSNRSGPHWALGPLLGLAFLATCLWWTFADMRYWLGQQDALLADGGSWGPGSAVWFPLAFFAASMVAVHALLGVLVWALSILLCGAWRPLLARPWLTLTACWIVAATIVCWLNSTWYPASMLAPATQGLTTKFLILPWGGWLLLLAAAVVLLALARTVNSWGMRGALVAMRRARLPALAIVAAASGAWMFAGPGDGRVPTTHAPMAPNVILVSIDSLRSDLGEGEYGDSGLLPHVSSFLDQGARVTDITTPLARTFGSWISMLTGRHPVNTGARANLVPRDLIHEGDTLPELLRATGYRSVFATDEVRFANIDRSYGFDQTITPPIGARDFLASKLGDLPLPNLLSDSPLAPVLFPETYANRAAHVTYRPEHFTARLARELETGEKPLFLAVHLTLAHWPYSWAGQTETRVRPDQVRERYLHALLEVDRQFGDLMGLLEQRGLLDDAIVLLVSDHGEALGRKDDSLLSGVQRLDSLWGSLWGHGTSVMGPNQFQVLFAARGYGRSSETIRRAQLEGCPASLEDLAPTILDLLRVNSSAQFDGLSLAAALREGDSARCPTQRIRFTETDFNTRSVRAGQFDERQILKEADGYYEIAPDTGWVQLRHPMLDQVLAQKERAALSGEKLLAALPGTDGRTRYWITNRRAPAPIQV
ncbi:MAG: hypothetical protein H6Q85_2151, partial [candidate division NC10 bacterium]|nr:hypothetical protein [candidate division NC10 bacterium]